MADVLFVALFVIVQPAAFTFVVLKAFQSLGPMPSATPAAPQRRWDPHTDGWHCDICRSICAGFPPEDVDAHLRKHEAANG